MNCRHTILACNRFIYIKINTRADYNYKSQITLKEWLQLWRYEIGFISKKTGGYKWWINKSEFIW